MGAVKENIDIFFVPVDNYKEAKELIKKNTRHYVKRQYTWFNNQMDIKFFEVKDEAQREAPKVQF